MKPTSRYLEDDWVEAVERTGTRNARDLIVKCIEEMHAEKAMIFIWKDICAHCARLAMPQWKTGLFE
jgi:hypothetical protein